VLGVMSLFVSTLWSPLRVEESEDVMNARTEAGRRPARRMGRVREAENHSTKMMGGG